MAGDTPVTVTAAFTLDNTPPTASITSLASTTIAATPTLALAYNKLQDRDTGSWP